MFGNTNIVYNKTTILIFGFAINTGNGLKEIVVFITVSRYITCSMGASKPVKHALDYNDTDISGYPIFIYSIKGNLKLLIIFSCSVSSVYCFR